MSLFSPLMKRKREKSQLFNYLWRMLLKFEEKNLKIHKLTWLLITWILKKLNSIPSLFKTFQKSNSWVPSEQTYKISHSKTQTLIVLNKFDCYPPNNRLVPLRILSYRKSAVVAPISSSIYKILFSFSWLSIIQILFRNLLTVLTSNTKQ